MTPVVPISFWEKFGRFGQGFNKGIKEDPQKAAVA
jgi:hypothetical protein